MAETITVHPGSYSTSGSLSGTRYMNCIGKGASTTASGNDYASGGSSSTATITYTFDFSGIPEGATIESVDVKVGGHAEYRSYSSSRKCEFQLYSGNSPKGEMTHFTSTSKQIITMTPGTWTREELQSAQLRVTLGYYGGLVNGVDFTVTYSVTAEEKTRIRIKLSDKGEYVVVKKILQKPSDSGAYVAADESAITKDHIVIMNN